MFAFVAVNFAAFAVEIFNCKSVAKFAEDAIQLPEAVCYVLGSSVKSARQPICPDTNIES